MSGCGNKPVVQVDLCDSNCGTMDCHSYGCVIMSSDVPNLLEKPKVSVYAQVAIEQQEKIAGLQQKDSRVGFVK